MRKSAYRCLGTGIRWKQNAQTAGTKPIVRMRSLFGAVAVHCHRTIRSNLVCGEKFDGLPFEFGQSLGARLQYGGQIFHPCL